jgi:hypothetical protein
MEYQGTITNSDGLSLGTLETLPILLAGMFPGLVFDWSSSGIQKLADCKARSIELPPLVQHVLEKQPSFLCGSIERDSTKISFIIGAINPVECIWVAVGGDEARVRATISLLEGKQGWLVQPTT